ncbi:MAG: hypothetical protein K2F63_01780, partial [Muribaculaceae bacterium]|nr:hypothetical protein [Muribaculaceae bacterium]
PGAVGLKPGQLEMAGKKVLVGCGSGTALELTQVQPAGKRPMDAADWLRGLRPGENGRRPWLI